MKKTSFIAAAIALSGFAFLDAGAQTSNQLTQDAQQGQKEQKEKVTKDQLPEPVKAALKSETYKNWTVGDIHKVVPAAGKAIYEVTMTNAQGQTGVVSMNERGRDASKD